jgi:hypothetical protein
MKLILVAILITVGACPDSLHLTADELAAHQPLRELRTFYDMHDPSSEAFPEHFRLVKSVFNDLIHQRTIEINYSDFKEEGEQNYPTIGVLKVSDNIQQQEIEFRIIRIATDKEYDLPFEIPEDYELKVPVQK